MKKKGNEIIMMIAKDSNSSKSKSIKSVLQRQSKKKKTRKKECKIYITQSKDPRYIWKFRRIRF